MNYNIITSPLAKKTKAERQAARSARKADRQSKRAERKSNKPPAPSKKKSLGYYNEAKPTGTGAKAGGGMSRKGVAKYRADNPGSKLKTAVTTPPSKLKPGSKAAKRRKSFCARSKSWTSERGRAARRRWNC
jgi:hypothetical protein